MNCFNEESYYLRIKQLNIAHYAGEITYYIGAPLRQVEKVILDSLPKKASMLDVACGSGRFTIKAAQRGHRMWGLDITKEAIIAAREETKRLGLDAVSFLEGDMTNMPFSDDRFDFVFCPRFSINAVATFSKRRIAIQEMLRVVKPGGLVYIESFNKLYAGRGKIYLPIKNILVDLQRKTRMALCCLTKRKYQSLLPGDIIYRSNKVEGAPVGYAHLATPFELKRLLPPKSTYEFCSIPEITGEKEIDLLKYFRYSIWILLRKN
jgi:SAM-dependent methyltransferase